MYWRLALLILLTASVPQAKAEPPDEEALRFTKSLDVVPRGEADPNAALLSACLS
jgi:hypothetical protein